MIKKFNVVVLPDYLFPGASFSVHNLSKEVKQYTLHQFTPGIDESIHQYISNPENKIHVAPHLKKIIQVDGTLVSSDRERDLAKFIVPQKKEFKAVKVARIKDILNCNIPNHVREFITESIMFDIIDEDELALIPTKTYSWNNATKDEWYAQPDVKNVTDNFYECVMTSRDVTVFDYISLLACSNNRPMTADELYKIKKLLSIEDTKQLALDVMNVLNPVVSFIELMIAFNTIPQDMKKRNKAKLLPLMQELFNLDVTFTSYSLENITNKYKYTFGKDPSPEQLEFICDHYQSSYIEKSSLFEFKLKIKEK